MSTREPTASGVPGSEQRCFARVRVIMSNHGAVAVDVGWLAGGRCGLTPCWSSPELSVACHLLTIGHGQNCHSKWPAVPGMSAR